MITATSTRLHGRLLDIAEVYQVIAVCMVIAIAEVLPSSTSLCGMLTGHAKLLPAFTCKCGMLTGFAEPVPPITS